jgi:hypothetical protein
MRLLRLAIGVLLCAGSATIAAAPAAAQDDAATDLRVTLSRLLGEHAFLTLEVVRTGAGDSPEADAAAGALDANTVDVVASIEGIYGTDAAEAFGQLWRDHIGFLVDYARAKAAGDQAAAELAADQLDRYVAEFSTVVATDIPTLPEEAVSGLIDEHVQQLQHVADLEASDYGDAYRLIRATYHHMFEVGETLALGIAVRFPDRFDVQSSAFSPATDVRADLDRLFGEHTYLAAIAMRAELAEAPDAASASQALTQNGADLTALIERLYGATAADSFGALWDSHLDAYLAYVAALAADDDDARHAALDALAAYRTDLSAFIADANPNVSGADLEAMLGEHTGLLEAQADQYAEGDFASAYETGREAYRHSGQMSASLARAITDQFPERFPDTALPESGAARDLSAILLMIFGVATSEARRWRRRRLNGRGHHPG